MTLFSHPIVSVGLFKVVPAVLGLKVAGFLAYKATDNPGIVDVTWTAGHWVAGLVYARHFGTLNSLGGGIAFGLLTLWAMRLGGHLMKHRVLPG